MRNQGRDRYLTTMTASTDDDGPEESRTYFIYMLIDRSYEERNTEIRCCISF